MNNEIHSTYCQTFIFIFDIYTNAQALCFIVSLELCTVWFLFSTVTFTFGVFNNFHDFLVQKFHLSTAVILRFKYLQIIMELLNTTIHMLLWTRKFTSNTILLVSTGWHDTRLLLQQPLHCLTRVHDGNTTIVGSLTSDPSDSRSGTTASSGTQFAGTGRLPKRIATKSSYGH